MRPHVLKVEDLTLQLVRNANEISVTDGIISSVVWTNDSWTGSPLMVQVKEVTYEYVNPVRVHIAALLIGSQQAS